MPYPEKGESQQDYISRAIREFMKEGYARKEAIGRSYGFWKTYKSKTTKKESK